MLFRSGRYDEIWEHIEAHAAWLGEERGSPVPTKEAVADWYDEVYLPVVRIVRASVPTFYRLEATETALALGPGDTHDVVWRAVPKEDRTIELVDMGSTPVVLAAADASRPADASRVSQHASHPADVEPARARMAAGGVMSMTWVGGLQLTRSLSAGSGDS